MTYTSPQVRGVWERREGVWEKRVLLCVCLLEKNACVSVGTLTRTA